MESGAWPFLVGGAICLVNSVNERDLKRVFCASLIKGMSIRSRLSVLKPKEG
jgi:hypothetical protein